MDNSDSPPRDQAGRFVRVNLCEFCGKKAPVDYFSDEDTANTGLGLVVCARKRCEAAREALPVADRIEHYRKQRDLNADSQARERSRA
jgi:hypothetical protein